MISESLLQSFRETAVLRGSFTTRAGKSTDYYIDKYLFETDPYLLDAITDKMIELFPDAATYDRIAAPELGAVPLAALLSVKLKKPYIIVKKEQKGYGTGRLIEGVCESGESVVLVEDILTTAGAALRACRIVEELGIKIIKLVAVVDREEGAAQNIADRGYDYDALIRRADLLNE